MHSIGLTEYLWSIAIKICNQLTFSLFKGRLLFMLEVDMSIPVLFSGVYFEHLFLLIEVKNSNFHPQALFFQTYVPIHL